MMKKQMRRGRTGLNAPTTRVSWNRLPDYRVIEQDAAFGKSRRCMQVMLFVAALTAAALLFRENVIGNIGDSTMRILLTLAHSLLELGLCGFVYLRLIYRQPSSRFLVRTAWWPGTGLFLIGTCLVIYSAAVGWLFFLPGDMPGRIYLPDIAGYLLYYLVLEGLTEELLFRGLPFAVISRGSWGAVLVSALAFSVYHATDGIGGWSFYLGMGIVWGILRRLAVPIWLLALWHGLFRLIFILVHPVADYRFGELAFQLFFPLLLLVGAALAYWLYGRGNRERPDAIPMSFG